MNSSPKIIVPPSDRSAELALAERLTVDAGLARVLVARGHRDAATAAAFLFPDLDAVTPPGDFPDIEKAAALVAEAARRGDKIFVAGDYDVDGLAAAALLNSVLADLGAPAEIHIPDRLTEGYDLTDETVARAAAAGARVLVTVDCGVRAHGAVKAARAAGLRVVVTDHHRLAEELPDADAVVSPHRLPEAHPARGLAGVGVAYKFATALLAAAAADTDAEGLLPLVALGTVCDVVDLTDENRVLVRAGLARFPGERFPGLKALAAVAGVKKVGFNSWHLAYLLGPRLNAAGRMGHAEFALRLLLAEDEVSGYELARRLEDFNRKRRDWEDRVAAEAAKRAEPQFESGRRVLTCAGAGWHQGVLGIVAARLVEKYYRPAVLIALEGESGRGSCRSIPPFDIHEALRSLSPRLKRFGGHRQAAGFEIAAADVKPFIEELEAYAKENLDEERLTPSFRVDGYLPLGSATATLAADLALLEPVGQGNAPAAFYSRATTAARSRRVFKNAHLELWLTDGPFTARGIGFNLAAGAPLAADDGEWGVVFTPVLDSWNAAAKVELRLKHAAPVAPAAAGGPVVTDRRGKELAYIWADFDEKTDAVYGLAGTERGTVIPYGGEGAMDGRYRKVFVTTPPFELLRLAVVSAAAEELILAFRPEEVDKAASFLEVYYPDRKALECVYREGRWGAAAEATPEPGKARACAIFAELGLNDGTSSGADGGAPKKALSSSPTFARCERLRAAGVAFANEVARWPAATWAAVARAARGDNA